MSEYENIREENLNEQFTNSNDEAVNKNISQKEIIEAPEPSIANN